MKKIIFLLTVLCGIFGAVHGVYADNMDGDYSIISSYTRLKEWRDAGCPSEGSCQIVVSRDFGWPTEDVVLDFGVKNNVSGVWIYYGNNWTVPENVTIKNLEISLDTRSTLNIEGKWHNNIYYEEGNPIERIHGSKGTINIGKNAEVKGELHLCEESTLNSNGGYVESVVASVYNGTSNAKLATISGNLVTDKLDFHNDMSINIAEGSVVETASIGGSNANTVNIESGATLYYNGTYGYLMANVTIKSGGVMTFPLGPLKTMQTFTIEEGGVCNLYQGVNQMSQFSAAKIKGSGTINLYGMYPFSYDGTDYWENPNVKTPGTVPILDATVVINEVSECDHADGRAYRFVSFVPSGETQPTQHIKMCASCRETVKGTEAPHSYTLEGDYGTFLRYRCVCGRSFEVDITTGTCGEDLAFVIEGGTVTFDGVGSITEFVPASGTWAEKSTMVEKVVLGSGITAVGEDAFSACSNLTQVEFDGSYEEWKALDIKDGNDALKYAEISFNDGSVLLSATEEYRTRADFIYEESDTGEFKLSLITTGDNKMTEDEVKKLKVIVASYGDDRTLSDTGLLVPTLTEDTGCGQWTGEVSESVHKLFVWNENCAPLTKNNNL